MSTYLKLANECWNVLKRYRKNIAILSNSWLYIIHDHPQFIKSYRHSQKENKTKKFKLKNFFFYKKEIKKKCDFLIISHLNNINMLNNMTDFYYGDIQSFLSKHEISSCLALINHTGNLDKKKFNCKVHDKTIIDLDIFILNNIKLFLLLTCSIINFYFLKIFNDKKFFNNKMYVKQILNLSSFKSCIQNLIIRNHVLKLLKEYKPSHIMTTFEGHPYERLIYNISKKFNSKIKTIGYQFSILKKNQFSIYKDLTKKNNPDIIFFSGSETEKIFKKKAEYQYIGKILGSKNYKLLDNKKKKYNNILVCPEGLADEYKIFLKFIIEYKKKYKDNTNFIFREHPRLSVKELDNYQSIKHDIKKINFSKRKIEEDFQISSYILYRGSGTVINAVSNNIVPIYLKINNPANIDPLYNRQISRIKKVQQLKNILKNKKKINVDLVNYSRNYFQKMNYNKLLEI
jgi:hypothetical protein